MTGFQKKTIHEMRLKGSGYKAIGAVLGLTRDQIRGYCKRNGLDGENEIFQKNLDIKIANGIICNYCGNEIKQPKTGRKRRFCSDKCRRKSYRCNSRRR